MNAKISALLFVILLAGAGGGAIYLLTVSDDEHEYSKPGNAGIADFRPASIRPLLATDIVNDPLLKTDVVKNQILVTMHDGHSEKVLQDILNVVSPGSKIVGSIPTVDMYQVEVEENEKHAIAKRLDTHPWIVSATLNVIRRPLKSFNDPFIKDQEKGWGIRRINVESAWDKSTGQNVTVAIVDSGTRVTHEEVEGKTTEEYSYATSSNKMQLKEFYTPKRNQEGQLVYELDYVAGHGTHVTGTATGAANNGAGTAGIAPDANVMPIQVLYFVSLDRKYNNLEVGYVSGSSAEIVAGITRAIAKGADVINLSLGPSYNPETIKNYVNGNEATRRKIEQETFIPRRTADLKAYKKVLDLAKKQNVILVNAAGNDNIPAEFDAFCYSQRMISVAATKSDDQRASFSNYGEYTTVSAPGFNIHSAFSKSDNSYKNMPGTSMACPHVAGTVALMKSIYPELTFEQARNILRKTGTTLDTDKEIGPLINAAAAVAETERIKSGKEEPPVDEPPMVEQPTPPIQEQPKQPTPEEVVNGPAPWANPQVQNLIDLWLSIATPPLEPVDGRPWFYDEWGRMLNNYTAFAHIPPDHGAMPRHQYVWQFAKEMKSVRHGTLYEFVLGMLRNGSFNPAPVNLPGSPGNQSPSNPGIGNPDNFPPTTKPETSFFTFDSLKGQWKGKNGQGDEVGLTIFDDKTAWVVRNGTPVDYKPDFRLDQLPAILELSSDLKIRVRIAIEQTGDNQIKIASYFNSSEPKFRENDQRYTYLLDRVDTDPGETNIARFGYRSATAKLHSTETVLVGSPDKNRLRGNGFVMPAAYKVVKWRLSRNGDIAWFVIDNRYPANGTSREPQIWSINTRTGKAQRSSLDTTKMSISEICTTPDGQTCWAIVDYSLPAAVQARREVKLFKASVGRAFSLVTDTDKNDKIKSLGLAQYYDPHAMPDGHSLIFNDGQTIWRASSNGFAKIIDRTQMETANLKIRHSAGPQALKVSGDGSKWVCSLVLYRDNKPLNTIVYGDISGSSQVIASSEKLIGYPNISFDGSTISYFDYESYKAMIGVPGKLRAMEGVGRYHTYDPEFFADNSRLYGVIGHRGTSTLIFGFFEDVATGKRNFSHSGLLLQPNPAAMKISDAGDLMIGTFQKTELVKAELGDRCKIEGHPEIEEVLYRIQDGRLHCRFKLKNPEDISVAGIMYMHNDFVPSGHAIKYEVDPFASWSRFGNAREHKVHLGYFDVNTPIKNESLEMLNSATFVVALKSRSKELASNYIVKMNVAN